MKKNIFILVFFSVAILTAAVPILASPQEDLERYIKQIDQIECHRLNAITNAQEKALAKISGSQQGGSIDFSGEVLNEYHQLYSDLQHITPTPAAQKIHQKFLEMMECEIKSMEQYSGAVSISQLISRKEFELTMNEKAYFLEEEAWTELAKISPVRMRIPDFQIRDYENKLYQATTRAGLNNLKQYARYDGREISPSESRKMFIELYQDLERQARQINPSNPHLIKINNDAITAYQMTRQGWEATTADGGTTQTSEALLPDGIRLEASVWLELYKFDYSTYLNNWIEPGKPFPAPPPPIAPQPKPGGEETFGGQVPSPVETAPISPPEKRLMQIYYGLYGKDNIPTPHVHQKVTIEWYIGEYKKPNLPISGVRVEVTASEGTVSPQVVYTGTDGGFKFDYLFDRELKKPEKKTIGIDATKEGYEDLKNIGRAITVQPAELAVTCEAEPAEFNSLIVKNIPSQKSEGGEFIVDLELYSKPANIWWNIKTNTKNCTFDVNKWNDQFLPSRESVTLKGIKLKAEKGSYLELCLDRTTPKAITMNLFSVYTRKILNRTLPANAPNYLDEMSMGLGLFTSDKFSWGSGPRGVPEEGPTITEIVQSAVEEPQKVYFTSRKKEIKKALTGKKEFTEAVNSNNIQGLSKLENEYLKNEFGAQKGFGTMAYEVLYDTKGKEWTAQDREGADSISGLVKDFFDDPNWNKKLAEAVAEIEKYPASGKVRLKVVKGDGENK